MGSTKHMVLPSLFYLVLIFIFTVQAAHARNNINDLLNGSSQQCLQ